MPTTTITATTGDSSRLPSTMNETPNDPERERLQVTIAPELKTELRVEAAKRGQTMAEVLEGIIRAWIEKGRPE